MLTFIFKSYEFDRDNLIATFKYAFSDGREFSESVKFDAANDYNLSILERALQLAHIIIGVSYYKAFPTTQVRIDYRIDEWQAGFFSRVYQNGLGQFAYENDLKLADLVTFTSNSNEHTEVFEYNGEGILALQSGGKDSLLTAAILQESGLQFDSLYISSGETYPRFIESIGSNFRLIRRQIDRDGLTKAKIDGALNGHVPVTYIVQSIALIQAILLNKNTVISSVAHEGEEPHVFLDEMPVTHQWSKTYAAEVDFAKYVNDYISGDIKIGSILRGLSELRVAEEFVKKVWSEFGHKFSSCNVANYKQGGDNSELKWCGSCPKCANSYLLFAPFLGADELKSIFDGRDLFDVESLTDEFKGLLGIDNLVKPFECVGEVGELRLAYAMAQKRGGYAKLPFDVPGTDFDYSRKYDQQNWTKKYSEGL